MKHSPTPWRRIADGEDPGCLDCVVDAGGNELTVGHFGYGAFFKETEDARRIVACVNACAGRPIELLEAAAEYSVAPMNAGWEPPHPIFRLADDNDKLRAAMREIVSAYENDETAYSISTIAKDALARK